MFEHVSSTCTDVLRIFSFCGVGKQIGRVESAYLYRAGFPRPRSDPSSKKFWVADQAAKFIRLINVRYPLTEAGSLISGGLPGSAPEFSFSFFVDIEACIKCLALSARIPSQFGFLGTARCRFGKRTLWMV